MFLGVDGEAAKVRKEGAVDVRGGSEVSRERYLQVRQVSRGVQNSKSRGMLGLSQR